MSAREIGDVALVELGCSAYHRAHELQDASTVRGGLVVGIESKLDIDTGEVSKVFLTLTRRRGKPQFDRLAAGDVGAIEPPNSAVLRSYARMLQEDNSHRRGPITTEEVERSEMALRLYEVIGGFR